MSRTNKGQYFGNRFNAIPITSNNDFIVLKDIYIVQVPEPLQKGIKLILDRQVEGIGKLKRNIFSPFKFSRNLQVLNYPILSAQNNFYTNTGEWLYLADEINIELLKYHFSKWCKEVLENRQFEYINKFIEGITISRTDITIPLNPYSLNEKETYYLYNLYPQYLIYQMSGKLKVDIDSPKGKGASQFEFYKLQNKEQHAEMIALPFKKTSKGYGWTYSLEIFIRTIEGINHPFLFLNMRANRFLDSIPYVKGRGLNAIVYRKVDETYEAFKLPLSFKYNEEKRKEWMWSYDLTSGFKSKSLEDLKRVPIDLFNGISSDIYGIDMGAGIIHGNHISSVRHPVSPRSSEFDEQPVFNEVLNTIKNLNTKTNIIYGNFLDLEDISNKFDSVPDKDTQLRFEQIPDLLVIDVYYSTDAWIKYLIDAINELFQPNAFNPGQGFAKASSIAFDIENYEFKITYKNKEVELLKKIKINRIYIDCNTRGKFLFDCELEEVNTFKKFLANYITPVEEVRAALFELEYEEESSNGKTIKVFANKVDPKSIIRNLLAKNNRVTQFISYQNDPYIQTLEEAKKSDADYKKPLLKYLNGVKDLFRQLGIIGKSPIKDSESNYPIFVGLWFMSKYKTTFDFGEEDRLIPYKLTLPILVALINDEVKIAVYAGDSFSNHRKFGKNFKVEWVPYKKGLTTISSSSEVFDELNEAYAKDLKRQFVNNALSSIYSSSPEKEIVLFTNAQNSRQYITGLTNASILEADLNLDLDGERGVYWNNTVIVRLVTDDRNETPGWIHIDINGNPIYESLRQGIFKLNARVYYLINAKGDTNSPSRDLKEFDPFDAGIRMTALEVGVYNTKVEDVPKYVHLTQVLRSRSMPIHFATAIKLPLPLHLACSVEEYLIAYYEEYFLEKHLKTSNDID